MKAFSKRKKEGKYRRNCFVGSDIQDEADIFSEEEEGEVIEMVEEDGKWKISE